jgi:hypothetical protein
VTVCTGCREDKPPEAFGFRDKGSGRRHRRCKACVATYGRDHYTRNRRAYIERSVANNRSRRRELKQRVWRYLADQACVECGERDPLVLDFDHVDPREKRTEIYWLAHGTARWQAIETEIGKCEVRCANCHRRRTATQFSWAEPQPPTSSAKVARLQLRRPEVTIVPTRPAEVAAGQRWCRRCGLSKSGDAFYRTNTGTCAECFRAYRQAHYRLNQAEYLERNTRLLQQRRRGLVHRVWEYLRLNACVDCGLTDPRVLEFDHRDPTIKRDSVTWLAHRGYRWAVVEAEIAKCDVRCANCHRRRTARQFDWPKRRIERMTVDLAGLEPATPAMRTQCSPN